MVLTDLLSLVRYTVLQGTVQIETGKVTNDTRNLEPGDVFVCIRGFAADGHLFAEEAARRGAAALVVEHAIPLPEGVTVLQVPDTREALAAMSAACWGWPAGQLKVIGITGTKGKSTTAWMLRDILNQAGRTCGLSGTIETDTCRRRISGQRTTPESCQLMQYLREMKDAGAVHAVMEVSSQGLKLKRTACIPFYMGIFTNLGEDHIGPGEHADLEEYKWCKRQLFLQCRTGLGNADDPAWEEMSAGTGCRKRTFGIRTAADYQAVRVHERKTEDGPGMAFEIRDREGVIAIGLPGLYNVYNALAAAAAALEMDVPFQAVQTALARVRVPGRMERIEAPGKGAVYVDYAHNAMSLACALQSLRSCTRGRLTVVFGCGGGRSRVRRYQMGETAGRLADETILTSDNPREEDPEAILADIGQGIRRTGGHYRILPDRREAVSQAVRQSAPGDTVLIAGKGHENYQEIRGVRYPMNDRELIRDALR